MSQNVQPVICHFFTTIQPLIVILTKSIVTVGNVDKFLVIKCIFEDFLPNSSFQHPLILYTYSMINLISWKYWYTYQNLKTFLGAKSFSEDLLSKNSAQHLLFYHTYSPFLSMKKTLLLTHQGSNLFLLKRWEAGGLLSNSQGQHLRFCHIYSTNKFYDPGKSNYWLNTRERSCKEVSLWRAWLTQQNPASVIWPHLLNQ